MKKIYILLLGVFVGGAALAQSVSNNSEAYRPMTRGEISTMVTPKGHFNTQAFFKSVDLLNEDFQGPDAPDLPAGWSGSEVATLADGTMVPAFVVGDAELANNGGYWPVPDMTGNLFALANDDGPPCDCDMVLINLTMPELDFTDIGNAAITFDIFHDQGFGGGDASLEISTDGGDSWDILVEALPVETTIWQTLIVPLYEYAGVESVTMRFTWTDGGNWASGFAVDNVIVGEIADYNLLASKLVFGNWDSDELNTDMLHYSQVPLSQAGIVNATGFISNYGFNDQENVDFDLLIRLDGVIQGDTLHADAPVALQETLTSDTLSVESTYIPTAMGTVTLDMTAKSTTGDDNPNDDMATASMEVTEFIYAVDNDAAEAFMNFDSYEIGNVFEINNDQMAGAIQFAVGAGTDVGAIIYGTLYEMVETLVVEQDGTISYVPELEFLDISTVTYEVQDGDLNGVGEANFVDLAFEGGATLLEGGKDYLAVVVASGADVVRTPVSGTSNWHESWINDGVEWLPSFSVPMVRLNMDASVAVEEQVVDGSLELMNMPNPATTNTNITFNLSAADAVSLEVYDMTGKLVVSENLGVLNSGNHTYELNVSAFEAGMYNYTLTVGELTATNKMIVE